jgi:hypothetical protein
MRSHPLERYDGAIAMRGKDWVLIYNHMDEKAMQPAGPKHIHLFRLYDDDGNLNFLGAMTDELYNSPGEGIFEPLDYAIDAWGCTELQVMNPKTKKYETI